METVRRLIFIVARHRKELFASLSRTFAGDDTVEVVMDRRRTERRAVATSPTADRRRRERRVREDTERKLRERGYVVVAVFAPRRARSARRSG